MHTRIHKLAARLSRGRGGAALADQILVSGSNFLTSIVLVRSLGLSEFGKYSIAYVLLLFANGLQVSFVASPMLTIAPLLEEKEKRRFVDGMFAIQLIASLMVAVAFLLAGLISRIFTTFYSYPCIIAFAFCVGVFQLQDWVRRYYFLYNKAKLAILSDWISYCLQLILLSAFWRLGSLTLLRTFLIIFATSLVAFAVGPLTDPIRPIFLHLRETWIRCRILSRDLLIASQLSWLGIQGVMLIGTAMIGTVGAGGLRATQNLAGPVNLFLTSLDNVVPIRISEEIKKKGTAGAYTFTMRMIFSLTLLFAPLLVITAIFGRLILKLLYGPPMVPFYWAMVLQLAIILVAIAQRLWMFFCRGIQDSRAFLRANAIIAIGSLIVVYPFALLWGPAGITLASLFGLVCATIYYAWHWSKFREVFLLKYPPASSAEVCAADDVKI